MEFQKKKRINDIRKLMAFLHGRMQAKMVQTELNSVLEKTTRNIERRQKVSRYIAFQDTYDFFHMRDLSVII